MQHRKKSLHRHEDTPYILTPTHLQMLFKVQILHRNNTKFTQIRNLNVYTIHRRNQTPKANILIKRRTFWYSQKARSSICDNGFQRDWTIKIELPIHLAVSWGGDLSPTVYYTRKYPNSCLLHKRWQPLNTCSLYATWLAWQPICLLQLVLTRIPL